MICNKCNSPNDNNAKYCNNCGTQLVTEIECLNCKTINPLNSKFCKNCGKELLSKDLIEKEIVLGNDFLIEFRDIYYEKLLKRLEQFSETINKDIHSAVSLLDSKNLKKEYSYSIRKCFDYLIESSKKVLSKEHIEYIKEKRDTFLSDNSESLFSLLNDLDEEIVSVLQNVSSNSLSSNLSHILKSGLKGFNSASTGGVIGVIEATIGAFSDGDKIDKKDQKIILDFNNAYSSVAEEFDTMWEKLCKLLDEIAENTAIRFEIDEKALKEQEKIPTIIENNLKGKDSSFYLYPNIPAEKKAGAMSTYLNMVDNEQLICLYDSTLFGSAKEGICLTTYAVYWKISSGDDGQFIGYSAIKKTEFDNDGYLIIKCEEIINRGDNHPNRLKEISKKYNGRMDFLPRKFIKEVLDEIVDYLKSRSTN